jgi:DNA-binding response OmpR family regulator
MSTVLLLDDEPNLAAQIGRHLGYEGHRVSVAVAGESGPDAVQRLGPDLIILDPDWVPPEWAHPNGAHPDRGDPDRPSADGLELCRKLRGEQDVALIVVSARGDGEAKIAALEAGADDYLTKPFSPRELVARVHAVLRRYRRPAQPAPPVGPIVTVGTLRLDVAEGRAIANGRPLDLRPKEFAILVALAERPGFVLDREALASRVWGHDGPGDLRTVDAHVAALRGALAETDIRVETVWGIGYKLVAL